MIPQSFIQDLLSRVDIVDVVDSAVKLRKAGANYSACCPFHSEKTPSFTVSPTKQFYHCFGCGAHGTVISFMMEFHGLGFIDAVKELAQRVGMTVPEPEHGARRAPEDGGRPGLTDLLARAARWYKDQLRNSETAIRYLKGRGVSGEIAARFGLGYAPEGWQGLAAVFPDYADNALVECGLVIRNDEGRRYDRFRDRVMFPIVNSRGDIVGFGGRVLGQGEPKYLNSPETPVFEKGRELYGLFQARQGIRAAGQVLVVEGYMDVVALAQHGVGYAVATLGTATTPFHVQRLLRLADHVVFAFDGDRAGRKAAWRALEVCLPVLADGKQVGFLFLPEEDDPDSYVRAHGAEAFEALVADAEPLSAYLLRELKAGVDMNTAEGRASFLKQAGELVAQVVAPNLSLAMRDAVARAAGLSLAEIPGAPPPRQDRPGWLGRPKPLRQNRAPTHHLRERTLLRALVARPDLAGHCAEALELAGNPESWATVSELVHGIRDDTLGRSTAALLQHLEDTGRGELAGSLQAELLERGDDYDFAADLDNLLARLRREVDDERSRSALAGVSSPSELSDAARAVLQTGRPGTHS
jgi:DNA primase